MTDSPRPKRPPYVPKHPTSHWIAKFWARVTKSDGCWEHNGPLHVPRWGYPQVRLPDGRMGRAHRMSWALHFGEVPDGKWVLHTCDNSRCVRPDHLYLGDHAQNMDDVSRRGRSGRRKLTEDQVRAIRASSEPQRIIAARFGIDQNAVWLLRAGRTYRHVA